MEKSEYTDGDGQLKSVK